ncbi:restriction endonuclease [Oenococcus sicerae]|uniref:Restriction endonuclease n=1 Tax=Oenococcus sicerae TaxID=2203724 RepID=A0ABX5QNI5_9LACO|nr:restriction endonuclease [Oenococcus sicerae]QAS70351.2 restriction endonuclease [Oenococcus sicerae]
MVSYKELKIGKHNIPTWDGMASVVLETAAQKPEWHVTDLLQTAASSIGLPEYLYNQSYPKYPDGRIIDDRAGWAISELTTAGLLMRPRRATYTITDLGRQVFAKYGYKLDGKIIHAQAAYLVHTQELKERNQTTEANDISDSPAEEELSKSSFIKEITEQSTKYNNEVATDLLQRIRESEPKFFENLVVKLLVAMGYQGDNGTSWTTQFTNDGGIDGVINQDPLGTSTVYVQAKRYKEGNVVQRPEIDAFYGALHRAHADRGVFITTSKYSDGATEAAKSDSIIIIDGIRLTNLMLKYQVGVQVKHHFDLFEIDEDFFDADI